MILVAALAIGWQKPHAEGVLRSVVSRYQKLKSLSVKIIHHADILADVKDSSDALSWLSPRRFELVSDRISIPKLSSDGKKLTTYISQLPPISEELENESGRMKSWESRGGILLSILMRGQMASQWFHPERSIRVTFDWGKALKWHDQEVSEIVETLFVRGASERISFYLSANHDHILGTEVQSGPNSLWQQYTEEQDNPDLPKSLGEVPGKG